MKLKMPVRLKLKKPRLLNPKNPRDAVVLMRRYMKIGLETPETLAKKIAKQSEKGMAEAVRKVLKKGEKPTVESLTKQLHDYPEFAGLCEEIGLSRAFFEGLAEKAIKEGGRVEIETKKEKIGRNDPCPCGSGKKYKHCCGK